MDDPWLRRTGGCLIGAVFTKGTLSEHKMGTGHILKCSWKSGWNNETVTISFKVTTMRLKEFDWHRLQDAVISWDKLLNKP